MYVTVTRYSGHVGRTWGYWSQNATLNIRLVDAVFIPNSDWMLLKNASVNLNRRQT